MHRLYGASVRGDGGGTLSMGPSVGYLLKRSGCMGPLAWAPCRVPLVWVPLVWNSCKGLPVGASLSGFSCRALLQLPFPLYGVYCMVSIVKVSCLWGLLCGTSCVGASCRVTRVRNYCKGLLPEPPCLASLVWPLANAFPIVWSL